MAYTENKTINGLTAITSADNTDELPIWDISASTTKKITKANLFGELNNLEAAEIQQLENIGATTISATQWGYLGAMTAQPLEAETDPIVGAINGIVKADGAGNISAAVAGTDYLTDITGESISDLSDVGTTTYTDGYVLRANGTGYVEAQLSHSDLANVGASDHHTRYALTEDLTSSEISQLQNIDTTTISTTQWGYLGSLDQSLATTDSPTFDALTVTSIGGIAQGNLVDKTAATTITGTLTLQKDSGFKQLFLEAGSNTATHRFILEFERYRGTLASKTIVSSGDILGDIRFWGYDGNSYADAVEIVAEVDGTPGDGDMPGRLLFKTSADGSETPTGRMRIDSTGGVTIASLAGSAGYYVKVDANGKLYTSAT